FMPSSMSYTDSIKYRMETTGVVQYLNSLFSVVFSVLIITLISIVGDVKKKNELSRLSYLFIGLTVLSIVAGYRIWIIALFAALILVFQSRIKRRHILIFVVVAFTMTFVISGGVRAARGGKNISENLRNIYTYFLDAGNKPFTELMWGFSDFTLPFSTFITIVENIPQNTSFQYDLYLRDFSLLIPTVVYPDRPLPVGVWYVKNFEPELYEKGGGLTFYVIGYGYLLAGPFGVFLHLFLWGGVLELFNKTFKMIGGAAAIFLYSYFFVSLFSFARGGEFFSFFKNSIIMYFALPLFLLVLLVVIIDSLKLKEQIDK
ncbi:MAG: O-antigen polysaccharide polymerase Wzy, partial [Minisyncoccia bacterium]